jgi:hypothetical protein
MSVLQALPANIRPGNLYWRGRLSTVDLLVLTSINQLIFRLKIFLPVLQNKLPNRGGQVYWALPFSQCSVIRISLKCRHGQTLRLTEVENERKSFVTWSTGGQGKVQCHPVSKVSHHHRLGNRNQESGTMFISSFYGWYTDKEEL